MRHACLIVIFRIFGCTDRERSLTTSLPPHTWFRPPSFRRLPCRKYTSRSCPCTAECYTTTTCSMIFGLVFSGNRNRTATAFGTARSAPENVSSTSSSAHDQRAIPSVPDFPQHSSCLRLVHLADLLPLPLPRKTTLPRPTFLPPTRRSLLRRPRRA